MNRSRALDGLRGIAVLATVAVHTDIAAGRAGYLGVDIFFVLSGYLITSILLRERDRVGRVSLRDFYLRRVLRLYPLLIALVLIAIAAPVLVGFADRGHAASAGGIVLSYLGDISVHFTWPISLGSLNQVWTLGIEEQFYLVWPVILVLVLRRRRRGLQTLTAVAAAGAAYALGMLVYLGATNGNPFAHVYFRPDLRAGAILAGCLLAITLHRMTAERGRTIVLPAPIGWLALAGLGAVLVRGPAQTAASAYVVAIPLTWALSVVLIAVLVTSPDSAVSRLLGVRPLAYLGLISYGLYLIHPVVFGYFSRHVGLARHDGVMIGVVISFGLAALSYHFLELPFLRLKDRVRSAGSLDAAPATPEPAEVRQ